MQPWVMPSLLWITLTTGARQLVVQEAAVTMWSLEASYRSWVERRRGGEERKKRKKEGKGMGGWVRAGLHRVVVVGGKGWFGEAGGRQG